MRRATARGFSLIELMIGLTLAMVLALVISQIFSNTREASRATEDAARIQESARFATDVISRTLRIAGYKSDPRGVTATLFPGTAPALDGTNGTGTASDVLIVRFQGSGPTEGTSDSTILDCLGAPVAAYYVATTVAGYNRFNIATGADGRNALFCVNTAAGASPGTELVPGVEAMQVIFGEDTNADGAADRFVPIGSLTNIDNVVAVRVYLLLSGSQNIRLATGSVTYPVGGVNYTYSDQKIRRVVTFTVTLRNRAP